MEKLGLLIESARERRGYRSQTALADAIGMSQTKFSRIERLGRGGAKVLPEPEDLRLVGDALGLSMHTMLEAAGYLEEAQDQDGDAITVPVTDPRAAVLRRLEGASDADIRKVEQLIAILIDSTANAGAHSSDTAKRKNAGEQSA